MISLSDNSILYHGSFCEVADPDLSKCRRYKDFGQGFYLTSSYEQARQFVALSVRKAVSQGIVEATCDHGFVSKFSFHEDSALRVMTYPEADAEWLHCVAGHRRRGLFEDLVDALSVYDIIAGKIANDATNATITTYMAGGYGPIGSREADDICIRILLPNRLEDQFCFRSQKSLNCLSYLESENVWI